MSEQTRSLDARDAEIRRLERARPRSAFLRGSALGLLALTAFSWTFGDFRFGELLSERRLANLERFVGELRPYPLQGQPMDAAVAARWAHGILTERGYEAAGITLALSVAAIVLAALGALLLAPGAARTVATPEPFVPGPVRPSRLSRAGWRGALWVSRAALVLVRSIPEYVLAFLFLAILGPTAWPIVLALALHNAGIVGKLQAEVIENLDPAPLAAWRSAGAGRAQILLFAALPLTLPRFLLFFFYRWETCVREATVLGLLGIASLGFWIVDARARNHYDEMFFLILLGAALVLVGDVASAVTREIVRRSG
ncbi:MAG: ABC transporter permease subunit [Acidobacteriota bacterium]